MEVKYYIGGIEVNPPLNNEELGVELNYDLDDEGSQAISLTEFEWGLGSQTTGNDAANLINAHKNNGLTNGVGVFEGLPFVVELNQDGVTKKLFKGYLDTSKAVYDCDRITITAVQNGGIDWINQAFESKTFKYMEEVEGIISTSDYTQIPYILTSVPNNKEAFLVLISTVFIIDTLVSEIKQLSQMTAGFTAWALAVDELVKAVLQITYIIGLVILLVKVIRQMIDLIIQPVKYLACMSELELCQKGCQSFGFTFSSSILESYPYNKSYIIPEKYSYDTVENSNGVDILGFTNKNNTISEGFFRGTFADLLRILKNKYNAKIIIKGNKLKLEREDFNNSAYNYVIPPVDQTLYTVNTSELSANYLVGFAVDFNDKHTVNNYSGVQTIVTTQPIAVINRDMVLTSGRLSRDIGLARGLRKTELTYAEKIIKVMLTVFDAQIGLYISIVNVFVLALKAIILTIKVIVKALRLLGIKIKKPTFDVEYINYTNFGSTIKHRIGMMIMENDFISTPKNVIFDVVNNPENTKVSLIDPIYTNSEYLYNNYHNTRSFIPTPLLPNANQYKVYSVDNVPFCFDDYLLLRKNNYLQDSDNRDGELLTCIWNIEKQTASMKYKINELYANNLTESIITPNGK